MSLQLILGNSGSGKSHHLYKNIVEASMQSPKTTFLVIVPEQFTMQTQRELVRLHPDQGLLNIDILSFQRLAHRIFEEVGADKRTILEETGKTLMLRRVAIKEQENLKILKGNLKKQGYLAQVKSLISEFTQYDIECDKMEMLLAAAKDKPQLYYKLEDIRLLYESFHRELQGKYITAEETLEALCQVAKQSLLLKDSVIALDGFTGFTPIQQKLLRELLALAKEVYVTVTIDAGEDFYRIRAEHELFYLSKKTIRSLVHMAEEAGCELKTPLVFGGEGCPRFAKSPQMAYLEKNLFRSGKRRGEKPGAEGEGISLHVAANPMAETHFAAAQIRRLVQSGYRYQDIAVIVGDMAAYASYIPIVFTEYNIPCFMDNTRSLLTNPFVEFLRAALDMIQQDYSRTSVFRMLRTGLCGVGAKEMDILENYVLACGIRGFAAWRESFDRKPDSMSGEEFALCEEIRAKIMEPLAAFTKVLRSKKTTVREKCAAFYELIFHFDIQRRLAEYEARFQKENKADLQKEYAQIYGIVMSLFDKLVELLGEETLSLGEYTEILEAGIEEEKVGIIPPAADRVQVGDLERTRLKDIGVLLFLGLNDGWVPSSSASGGMLSDMEREELLLSGVELAPTSRQDSYIQKFYLYLNMTKPSQRLYLSYCKASMDGSAMRPSYVLRTVSRLFPQAGVIDEDAKTGVEERVASVKSGLDYLIEGLYRIRETPPTKEWLELYNWYRREGGHGREVERLVEAAFLTFDERGIGKKAARELYGEVLSNSVSRLEKFAACAFAHFLQYGLKLEEREEYTFQPVDMGRVVHSIVEIVSAKITDSEEGWLHIPDEKRRQLVDEAVLEVTKSYGKQILHSSARNEYMIERIRRIMYRTIWALQKQIVSGHFYPEAFEVAFSRVENLEAVNIALSAEEKMKLRGRIDRIDICHKEKEVYVKVVDYKSGNTGFDLVALYHGLQLQLVVYMGAALEMEKRLHPDKEVIPAGIFYYRVKDPLLSSTGEETPEQINEKILRELRPEGLINGKPEVFREMDLNFTKSSDVIPVTLNKDGSLSKLSKAASSEQFAQLNAYVYEKIREIGSRIMEGETAPIPYERKQKTGCDYCIYRSVCGWDSKIPGAGYHRIKEAKAEDIWESIGQKNRET